MTDPALALDCPLCAAHDLDPGESATCVGCGAELSRPREERPGAATPSLARQVDTLLRDCHALALWLQHSSVRAISLEPDRAPRSDESDDARDAQRESLLTRGKRYAARLDALTASDPQSAAVVRYLAERGGPARVRVVTVAGKSLGSSWHELLGLAFARWETKVAWHKAGDVRLPASKHGKALLEKAARAWGST